MKTPEDEAFDDLARKQGAWGGGFKAKQAMAADKQKEYDPCPACIKGVVCRTPKCGRLALPLDHPFRNAQPAQEPVAKPYAYEYGRCNADGTYSVVIEKGDLVQTMPAVFNYVRPRNACKDWPIKELFAAPPQRTWVGLTYEDWKKIEDMPDPFYQGVAWAQAKLKEKNG